MVMLRDSTLTALERTYQRLDDDGGAERIRAIRSLWPDLRAATESRDVAALRALKARFGAGREWELEQVQLALAIALGRHGRWREAEAEYRELGALLEQHRPAGIVEHGVHIGRARTLRKLGRPAEALQAAATGQFQSPLDAAAHRELGKAHFALRQFEEALGAWQQALRLAPNDPHLHWRIAFSRWSIARDNQDEAARRAGFEAAAGEFEQAALLFDVRNPEGWAWSRLWAGRSRQGLGEHDEALRHLRAAAGYEPTATVAALLLGEVDLAIGDRNLARARFEAAADAVEGHHETVLDVAWGATITGAEVGVRAAVGLGPAGGRPARPRGRGPGDRGHDRQPRPRARAATPRSRRSRSGPRRCSGRRRDRGARADAARRARRVAACRAAEPRRARLRAARRRGRGRPAPPTAAARTRSACAPPTAARASARSIASAVSK